MLPQESYVHYTIGREYVKITKYEKINTGRKKKASQNPKQSQAMTSDALDVAYQYRQRAKREKLLRLADVNFGVGSCVSVTLTFRENMNDYDTAVKAFKLFTKRLRRKLKDVLYIATIEIQKRGAYHFHLLINIPNVQFGLDNLAPLWNNGINHIESVTDVKSLVLYMTKDFEKQSRNHPLFGQRCYFVSQGLIPCVEVNTWNGTTTEIRNVQRMLNGRRPNKSSHVNSTKAGFVEYEDYYFPTNFYPSLVISKLRETPI